MTKVKLEPRRVKYYNFDQNNSGGYFYENEEFGVCEHIIIAAGSAKEASERFEAIGEKCGYDFYSYCSCCGERWDYDEENLKGTDEPEIYGEKLVDCKAGIFIKNVYLHEDDLSFYKHELLTAK